jgi:hypothetical protein
MGAKPYWYFVPYDSNPGRALEVLREREFDAGRYGEVAASLDFNDPAFESVRPGARHGTIAEAVEDSGDSGTQSNLDIVKAGPAPDYGTAGPLDPQELEGIFGTRKPTREVVVARKSRLWGNLDRGQCAYVVVYEGVAPMELFFAGYSYD